MVAFTTTALLSLAAIGALAAPSVNEKRTGLWHHKSNCMTTAQAQQVASNYAELIRSYTQELADATLAVDFVDYSESVNSLINTCPQGSAAVTLPLLAPTFSSRAQFEAGQGQQAPINFEQLNIHHDCNSVTIRWKTTNTAPIPNPRPVVGIILIEVVKAAAGSQYPWIIQTVYSEFDAAAWLQNLEQAGICSVIAPSSPPLALPSGTVPAATTVATSTGTTVVSAVTTLTGYTTPAAVTTTSTDTCTETTTSTAAATYTK